MRDPLLHNAPWGDCQAVLHPNLDRIERYLDGRFRRAFIRSVPAQGVNGPLAHSFFIETGRRSHTVLVMRGFLAIGPERVEAYLTENDLSKMIREAGETPVVVTIAAQDDLSAAITDVHLVS